VWILATQDNLRVDSGYPRQLACGFWLPKTTCVWNLATQDNLRVESGYPRQLACGIWLPRAKHYSLGCSVLGLLIPNFDFLIPNK
jgi:hypothetical protein